MVYSAQEGAFLVNRIGQSGGEQSGDSGGDAKTLGTALDALLGIKL